MNKEYYFQKAEDDGEFFDENEVVFIINSKSLFDSEMILNDTFNGEDRQTLQDNGFYESMEGYFECQCTVEEGKAKLLALGMTEKEMF